MHSINILHVAFAYKPAYQFGGPVVSVSALAEEQVRRGHNVSVVTTNAGVENDIRYPIKTPIKIEGVKTWFWPYVDWDRKIPLGEYFSKSVGFRYTPGLYSWLSDKIEMFDVIHLHAIWSYTNLIAGKIAIDTGKPLFLHQRGAFSPMRMKYHALKKYLYFYLALYPIAKHATRLIALNSQECVYYKNMRLHAPCAIVPNGVDTTRYRRVPQQLPSFLQDVDETTKVVLFMSRLHYFKGVDFALDVFIKVARQISNAVFVIAGPDEHGMANELGKKIASENLQQRIRLVGMVTGDEKLNLLARADVFCLPSIGEGFSMAVLEAMASNTAIMVTPECNFDELSIENAGIVLERNVLKWSEALMKVLVNDERMRILKRNAYQLVCRKYAWSCVADQFDHIYSLTRKDSSEQSVGGETNE